MKGLLCTQPTKQIRNEMNWGFNLQLTKLLLMTLIIATLQITFMRKIKEQVTILDNYLSFIVSL
jgi:hypothetical protein